MASNVSVAFSRALVRRHTTWPTHSDRSAHWQTQQAMHRGFISTMRLAMYFRPQRPLETSTVMLESVPILQQASLTLGCVITTPRLAPFSAKIRSDTPQINLVFMHIQ